MISTPWVEKYRPTKFEDIILDKKNKQIFENIIDTDCFPNLLAHGFPGTGKTTTIMNLITLYFRKKKISPFSMIIHLNASDERGIDIIRNQINSFVNSKSLLFRKENCLKFVVLDEIDYMTKNAQQALKYLIQTTTTDVRFCLMCNYISRIDEGLQNDFLKIRFNRLPLSNTFSFLKDICINEQVDIQDEDLYKVINFFKNDMRSMINFLQCNQHCQGEMMKKCIVSDKDFELFLKVIASETIENACECLYQITMTKNISHKQFYLSFLHYCFQQNLEIMFAKETLNGIENLLHNSYCETKYFIPLALKKLQQWLKRKKSIKT
jgi:replication factor C subunit 3/5